MIGIGLWMTFDCKESCIRAGGIASSRIPPPISSCFKWPEMARAKIVAGTKGLARREWCAREKVKRLAQTGVPCKVYVYVYCTSIHAVRASNSQLGWMLVVVAEYSLSIWSLRIGAIISKHQPGHMNIVYHCMKDDIKVHFSSRSTHGLH